MSSLWADFFFLPIPWPLVNFFRFYSKSLRNHLDLLLCPVGVTLEFYLEHRILLLRHPASMLQVVNSYHRLLSILQRWLSVSYVDGRITLHGRVLPQTGIESHSKLARARVAALTLCLRGSRGAHHTTGARLLRNGENVCRALGCVWNRAHCLGRKKESPHLGRGFFWQNHLFAVDRLCLLVTHILYQGGETWRVILSLPPWCG